MKQQTADLEIFKKCKILLLQIVNLNKQITMRSQRPEVLIGITDFNDLGAIWKPTAGEVSTSYLFPG